MSEEDELQIQLRENLTSLEQRIRAACTRAGRLRSDVQLVAVTKSVSLSVAMALHRCGQRHLGENRPQQLVERARAMQEKGASSQTLEAPHWHLIGQLQSNKIRSVLPWTTMIHSVDSFRQLQRISRVAEELSFCPRVLLQVNISGEASKSGFDPNVIRSEWRNLLRVSHVELAGLMTMAPLTEEEADIRHSFRGLRELRDELREMTPEWPGTELSMGMSHDFEIAIEEGATLVRIGSLLFAGCGA